MVVRVGEKIFRPSRAAGNAGESGPVWNPAAPWGTSELGLPDSIASRSTAPEAEILP